MSAAALASLKLGEAEEMYRVGLLTQTEYEAYRRAWAICAPDGYRNREGWLTPSDLVEVEQLAAELVAEANNKRARR